MPYDYISHPCHSLYAKFQEKTFLSQEHSHVFGSEGAQSPEAIMGPSSPKMWEGPSILLLYMAQKVGGAGPQAP